MDKVWPLEQKSRKDNVDGRMLFMAVAAAAAAAGLSAPSAEEFGKIIINTAD